MSKWYMIIQASMVLIGTVETDLLTMTMKMMINLVF